MCSDFDYSKAPRARHEGEIDVFELASRRERGEGPLLVDCREPGELAIVALEDCLNLPMSRVESDFEEELGKHRNEEIVLMCHSGVRSAHLQHFLRHHGFTHTRNLLGGISAWIRAIDPTLQDY